MLYLLILNISIIFPMHIIKWKYHIAKSRRPFRPSSGTSTSGVKDLSDDFDEVGDPTEHVDIGDDGIMLQILFCSCLYQVYMGV